ncbi:aspartate/glutamate racemase family protein [Bacillaceae bacterium Marseille-Q3522]|nr:aspartate/glutamate racemase family protein [Bacillaceae bacterium Marseille-Q3522]
MKTIGLIGGLSWESTTDYYRYVNELVQKKQGELHSAKCLMYSFDFQEVVELQQQGHWQEATAKMVNAAKTLEQAGADLIVICTNTMHLMAEDVKKAIAIPLIHIVDAIAARIKEKGIKKVGLLGTRYTMEKDFYKDLLKKYGIDVLIPNEEDRITIHEVIFAELCKGDVLPSSKEKYQKIIQRLGENGAEGIILGCTEIPLLIKQQDSALPLFDSTKIHCEKAVEAAGV